MGRKDSKTASYALADSNLPSPDEGLLSIISKFHYQGLSATDMVALSGKLHMILTIMGPFNEIMSRVFHVYIVIRAYWMSAA